LLIVELSSETQLVVATLFPAVIEGAIGTRNDTDLVYFESTVLRLATAEVDLDTSMYEAEHSMPFRCAES